MHSATSEAALPKKQTWSPNQALGSNYQFTENTGKKELCHNQPHEDAEQQNQSMEISWDKHPGFPKGKKRERARLEEEFTIKTG